MSDAIQQADAPADRGDKSNGQAGQQEKRHTDIFLLTRGTTPGSRLDDVPVFVGSQGAFASTCPAFFGRVGAWVGGFAVGCSVAGTVVCGADAFFLAGLAEWEDAGFGDGVCFGGLGGRVFVVGGGG